MAKIKGRAIFNEDICKGCGLCVEACPTNIVFMDESRINKKGYHPAGVTDNDKCIACGFCAETCPDLVIEVVRE